MIEAGLDGIEASYAYHKTSYGGAMTAEDKCRDLGEKGISFEKLLNTLLAKRI